MDYGGQIEKEYRKHLNPRGQPGVGDLFFQKLLTQPLSLVERVNLEFSIEADDYLNFPADPNLAEFDKSDRKFVAAALFSGAPVANAVDTDWYHYRDSLSRNGVEILFICGCDPEKWFI